MNSPYQKKFGEESPFGGSSLYGARYWGVDSFGRLIGKNQHIWLPTENTAVCKVRQHKPTVSYSYQSGSIVNVRFPTADDVFSPMTGKIGCKGVDPECECGFYAYYEHMELLEHGALGVIEGYGLVTEGPMGFRSMKAKVLAVALGNILVSEMSPDVYSFRSTTTPALPAQVIKNYPDTKFFETAEAMYSEFPLSDPPLYDPDVPGFWERSIK